MGGRWAIEAPTAGMSGSSRGFMVSGPDNAPDTYDFVPVVFSLSGESNWALDQLRTFRSSEIPQCTKRLNTILTQIYQPAVCPAPEDVMGANGLEDSCLAGGAAAACPVA